MSEIINSPTASCECQNHLILGEYKFNIGLREVKVVYENFIGMKHLNLYGKPISETGFRSYFFSDDELKENETMEQFVYRVALTLNKELQHKPKPNGE